MGIWVRPKDPVQNSDEWYGGSWRHYFVSSKVARFSIFSLKIGTRGFQELKKVREKIIFQLLQKDVTINIVFNSAEILKCPYLISLPIFFMLQIWLRAAAVKFIDTRNC